MSNFENLDGATVAFINHGSGTCIALQAGQPKDGTTIFGYQFNNGKNQQWKLERVANNTSAWPTWKLRNIQSGTYADLQPGTAKDSLTGWHDSGSNTQCWRLVTADPAGLSFVIQNVANSAYVDLNNGNPANESLIFGWSGVLQIDNSHQLWRILRIN